MKEQYTTPELWIVTCSEEDILTASVGEDTETGYGPVHPIG